MRGCRRFNFLFQHQQAFCIFKTDPLQHFDMPGDFKSTPFIFMHGFVWLNKITIEQQAVVYQCF